MDFSSFSQNNPNPVIDNAAMEQVKKIGLYVGIALVVWYVLKREKI